MSTTLSAAPPRGARTAAPPPASPPGPPGPVLGAERIAVLDALRGFALFGILVVNITVFALAPEATASTLDTIVDGFIQFAFSDKFWTLFSFLFGYGLAVQVDRAAARGAPVVPRMRRRLLALFLIGVLHAVLLFFGDVLTAYALAGAVLLVFRKLSARGAAKAAIGILVGLFVLYQVMAVVIGLAGVTDDPAAIAAHTQQAIEGYRGSFGEVVRQRLGDLSGHAPLLLGLFLPNYLALFFAGLAAGKARLLHRTDYPSRTLWRVCVAGLAIGLPAAVLALVFPISGPISPAAVATRGLSVLTAPALTAAYLAALLLFAKTAPGQRLFAMLAPAGRVALTSYLGQSAICAFLFTGYGLALAGRLGATTVAVLAIAIFAVQTVASAWWLRRFRFGPAEWLLRSVTYRQRQPWRI